MRGRKSRKQPENLLELGASHFKQGRPRPTRSGQDRGRLMTDMPPGEGRGAATEGPPGAPGERLPSRAAVTSFSDLTDHRLATAVLEEFS